VSGSRAALGRASALALAVVGLDQLTKALARGGIEPRNPVELPLGIDLVRVENRGIAFGLLNDAGVAVIIVAALAFLGLLAYFLVRGDRARLWIPIGLLAGGAIGNLIDRVHEGFVTDFIDPPAWPAFNVADIAITLGTLLLFWAFVSDGHSDRAGAAETERAS
jgi:signal peptidase II